MLTSNITTSHLLVLFLPPIFVLFKTLILFLILSWNLFLFSLFFVHLHHSQLSLFNFKSTLTVTSESSEILSVPMWTCYSIFKHNFSIDYAINCARKASTPIRRLSIFFIAWFPPLSSETETALVIHGFRVWINVNVF